jgi:formyl-CoA transferase
VLAALERAQVPSGKVFDVADIMKDAHYLARGMLEQHQLPDGKPVKLPGIVPKLSDTPGATEWVGPKLGEHNAEVLGGLGYDDAARRALMERGVI